METILKTTIKDNSNITTTESVESVFEKLMGKGSFILINRVDLRGDEKMCVIRKSSVKMVK